MATLRIVSGIMIGLSFVGLYTAINSLIDSFASSSDLRFRFHIFDFYYS